MEIATITNVATANVPLASPHALLSDQPTRRHFWLLVLLTVVLMIPVISVRSADPSYLVAFSEDEYMLLSHTRQIQAQLVDGNIGGVLTEPLRWGYGFLFQLVYAVGTLPWFLMDSFTGQIVAGRMLGLLFTGLTIGYVYRINVLITRNAKISFALACCLLTATGLFVEHKYYSVDQLANFLLVSSLFYLCRDRLALGRDYLAACLLFGLATAQKLPLGAAGPALAAAVVLAWLHGGRLLWHIRQAVIGVVLVAIGYVASNFSIFFSAKNFSEYLQWIERGHQSMATGNFGSHEARNLPARIAAWLWMDTHSVSERFFNIGSQIVIVVLTVAAGVMVTTRTQHRQLRSPMLILGFGCLPLLLINILGSDRIWHWHIAPALFFALSGIAAFLACISHWPIRRQLAVTGAIVALLVLDNIGPWWAFQSQRLTEHQTPEFVQQRSEMLEFREQIVELINDADKNGEPLDLIISRFSMENPEWYSKQGIRTERELAQRLPASVSKNFPIAVMLNLNQLKYEATRESILAETRAALDRPCRSKQTKQWYQYELVDTKSNAFLFKRTLLSAELARQILASRRSQPVNDPQVIQATYGEPQEAASNRPE